MGTSESRGNGVDVGDFLIGKSGAELVAGADVADGHANCSVPNVGMVAPAARAYKKNLVGTVKLKCSKITNLLCGKPRLVFNLEFSSRIGLYRL